MAIEHIFKMPDNYIYLYHLGVFIVIPAYADSVQDYMQVSFASSNPLMRSAPIYSYQHSGPRTVQVNFDLHRDLMYQINYNISNAPVKLNMPEGDDYVDILIKYIEAAAVPNYEAAGKMVNPPMVALRLGNDIFIKGVITGTVGKTYQYPILEDGRYANVSINFSVSEVEPFDAKTIAQVGGYRGALSDTLERNLWVVS